MRRDSVNVADEDSSIIAPLVSYRGVSKSYAPGSWAVRDLNLDVARGEFLTFLGPSGSGKTTSLMMLAGFETPTSGEILLEGRSLENIPANKRGLGVVFQNYALFPHMSVAENIAFPLRLRGIKGADADQRVTRALEMVNLPALGARRPTTLSGGQQQRVALARALVFEPQLVLMDEPMGALDRQLREHLHLELQRIQRQLGLTIVYVTHDQSEALLLSDRIAVFADGRLQQIAAPTELYEQPANIFVASFVGDNNWMEGVVEGIDGDECVLLTASNHYIRARIGDRLTVGGRARAAIRPEHIFFGEAPVESGFSTTGFLETILYGGDQQKGKVRLGDGTDIVLRIPPGTDVHVGAQLPIWSRRGNCLAFPVLPKDSHR